ncbi:VanZ family protein [Tahibacter aquaticus]|uniref:VanZ family protein n=1 Tax=Tahibacter aquaticus TaxID=520092 RepID=A0A4R6YLX8_9GAMM|nr:VanZ family protein [Tahibacter aquaticus]TDR38210.1 VanZ family protein [Tahibacter aquaticus]
MKLSPRPLRYFWLWRAIGRALILLSLAIALVPAPRVIGSVAFGDKIGHALAFALLMLWYAQLYAGPSRRLCAAGLVLFGASIEVLQTLVPYRSGDLWDLLADALGVALGLLLAHTRLADVLSRIGGRAPA